MSDILIGMEAATPAAGRQLARCGGVETLSAGDYCRLAEECLLRTSFAPWRGRRRRRGPAVGENDGIIGRPHGHRSGGVAGSSGWNRIRAATKSPASKSCLPRSVRSFTSCKLVIFFAGANTCSAIAGEDLALPSASPVVAGGELGNARGTTVGFLATSIALRWTQSARRINNGTPRVHRGAGGAASDKARGVIRMFKKSWLWSVMPDRHPEAAASRFGTRRFMDRSRNPWLLLGRLGTSERQQS
jgi:hypothetical protein